MCDFVKKGTARGRHTKVPYGRTHPHYMNGGGSVAERFSLVPVTLSLALLIAVWLSLRVISSSLSSELRSRFCFGGFGGFEK